MLFARLQSTDPYMNLATEEFLLKNASAEEIFLLWQNRDTVVLGRHQNTMEEVDTVYAAENNIQIARRITGGGAVYHDLGNCNFSFIGNCREQGKIDFSKFSHIMADAIGSMGLNVQVSGRNDLTIDGRKISGSAQIILGDRVLHHGTLLYQTNLDKMERVLTVDQEKLFTNGVCSVRSRVTNLSEHFSGHIDISHFGSQLLDYFAAKGSAQELSLSEADLHSIQRLRDEKYSREEWIYGRSPGYSAKKRKHFKFGRVDIALKTGKRGIIEKISFQGDFFGSGDIFELEQRFIGLPLCQCALHTALDGFDVDKYISGASCTDLIDMILA